MLGGHSALDPPLPITNRTVKRSRADDSAHPCAKVGHRQATHQNPSRAPGEGFLLCSASLETDRSTSALAARPRFPFPRNNPKHFRRPRRLTPRGAASSRRAFPSRKSAGHPLPTVRHPPSGGNSPRLGPNLRIPFLLPLPRARTAAPGASSGA